MKTIRFGGIKFNVKDELAYFEWVRYRKQVLQTLEHGDPTDAVLIEQLMIRSLVKAIGAEGARMMAKMAIAIFPENDLSGPRQVDHFKSQIELAITSINKNGEFGC